MAERKRQPRTISDEDRVRVIVELRRRGWSWQKVGDYVGMSRRGAQYAMLKSVDPDRFRESEPGDV